MNAGGPLDGIKVVEIGVAMAGPFCAMMLADHGAEVVQTELFADPRPRRARRAGAAVRRLRRRAAEEGVR